MSPADECLNGTVFLFEDPSPAEGPIFYISGEDAVARGLDDDWRFRPSLEIGVGAGEIVYLDDWYLYSLKSEISRARLSSVAAAVRCNRSHSETWPERIYVHDGDDAFNQYLENYDDRTYIEIDDFTIFAIVREMYAERPKGSRQKYRDMLESVARKYDCHIADVRYADLYSNEIDEDSDFYDDMEHVVDVCIESLDPDAPARKLIECGRALYDYLTAIRDGKFDAGMIVKLLQAGHVDLLVGSSESAHLEVKSSLYNIDEPNPMRDRQRIELAQDVARFANGDRDAVLVIGYKEVKVKKQSQIKSLTPIKLARFDAAQYQAVLDARIIPPLSGIVIDQIHMSNGRGVAFIYVPRQPEEMQPYLVHGAIVGDKVEGEFFSIVQRRGEGSINTTAAQIHGYIVAGKAFLQQR